MVLPALVIHFSFGLAVLVGFLFAVLTSVVCYSFVCGVPSCVRGKPSRLHDYSAEVTSGGGNLWMFLVQMHQNQRICCSC